MAVASVITTRWYMAEALSAVLEKHIQEYETQVAATKAGQDQLLAAVARLQQELQSTRRLLPNTELLQASAKLVKLRDRLQTLNMKAVHLEGRVRLMQSQFARVERGGAQQQLR